MVDVDPEHVLDLPPARDQDPVETVAANGANPALGKCVRLRCPSKARLNLPSRSWIRYVRFADEPSLRAFNTIPEKVEFQKVAYRVGLDIWVADRSIWHRLHTSTWRWDETYDVDFRRFPGNFWRSFATLERIFTRFNIPAGEPGYYRLRVAYFWYGATQSYGGTTMHIPDYLTEEWVTTHFGLSNDKTAGNPKDKYCAFGVDPQGGP